MHHHFMQDSLFRVFFQGLPYWQQGMAGLIFGGVASLFAWMLIQRSMMKPVRNFFVQFLKPFEFRLVDIVFIAACAGIGEELLFRATIQPVLGIWLTALLFVALHGYLSIHNWPLTIYGIFMVFVAAGLGYLFREAGIIAAIAGHFAIDVSLLLFIRSSPLPETHEEQQEQASE